MRRLALLIVLTLPAACAVYPGHPSGPGPGPAAHIPAGHMPPPGACRIWYPGRPPGQQPPPGDCGRLQYQVPPGAILVRG